VRVECRTDGNVLRPRGVEVREVAPVAAQQCITQCRTLTLAKIAGIAYIECARTTHCSLSRLPRAAAGLDDSVARIRARVFPLPEPQRSKSGARRSRRARPSVDSMHEISPPRSAGRRRERLGCWSVLADDFVTQRCASEMMARAVVKRVDVRNRGPASTPSTSRSCVSWRSRPPHARYSRRFSPNMLH